MTKWQQPRDPRFDGRRIPSPNNATAASERRAHEMDGLLPVGFGSSPVPTGTGFRHVTAGTEDGSAKLVEDADVAAANKDGLAATPSLRTLGAGAQQACAGDDARLSDARTPLAHVHAGTDITSLIIEPRTSDPASPEVGRVWLRTDL